MHQSRLYVILRTSNFCQRKMKSLAKLHIHYFHEGTSSFGGNDSYNRGMKGFHHFFARVTVMHPTFFYPLTRRVLLSGTIFFVLIFIYNFYILFNLSAMSNIHPDFYSSSPYLPRRLLKANANGKKWHWMCQIFSKLQVWLD